MLKLQSRALGQEHAGVTMMCVNLIHFVNEQLLQVGTLLGLPRTYFSYVNCLPVTFFHQC